MPKSTSAASATRRAGAKPKIEFPIRKLQWSFDAPVTLHELGIRATSHLATSEASKDSRLEIWLEPWAQRFRIVYRPVGDDPPEVGYLGHGPGIAYLPSKELEAREYVGPLGPGAQAKNATAQHS